MADIYFTKDHEWVRVEGDTGTVGISEYATEQLGDVVFVELPDIGKSLGKGDEAAVVESVKAASEVYSPVAGDVTEVNGDLTDAPDGVNEEPLGKGWFYKMTIKDKGELSSLMDETAYKEYVATLD
jgi:glycine cleavage system H protein